MLTVYKILVDLAYLILRPYFALKRSRAPIEWTHRLALDPTAYPDCRSGAEANGPRTHLCHFHASSVGEVRVLQRLIDAVKATKPDIPYCISTYTRTGYRLARELFGDAEAIFYFPLDCRLPMKRFFRLFRPRGIVIVETEIWPCFLDFCRTYKLPLVLANGRLSTGSTRWYRMFRRSLRRLFNGYRAFLMQTEADQKRMIEIGADPARMQVLGNIKHDVVDSIDFEKKRDEVRSRLGLSENRLLLICASTRPGEEEIICQALKQVSAFPESMTVLLAPRHLDRLDEVKQVLARHDYPYIVFSELESSAPAVILMDRIGFLMELFYGADLAFVGGTLVDLGGHNIMEPVLAGVPVLFGPSVDNIRDASRKIINGRLGMMIHDADEFADVVNKYARGDLRFDKVEAAASSVAQETAEIIIRELEL